MNPALFTAISEIENSNAELHSRLSMLKDEQLASQIDTAHLQLLLQLQPLKEGVKALIAEKDEWENVAGAGSRPRRRMAKG